MNDKPLIKLFKTCDKYYMYDVNKNTILNISDKNYDFLGNYLKGNFEDSIEPKEISELRKNGFLSSNRVKDIVHPDSDLLQFYLDNSVRMLILQVTQQCNFRCGYCVYSGEYLGRVHSNKRMSLATALKGIDFYLSHSKNQDTVHIGFYGGEPLLEFNLIKQCMEYVEEKAEGKKIIFSMTTNGSLLTNEIIEFLYKHDVSLTISLDGPKEVHDKHRKFASNNQGSFDKVINNIMYIKKTYPEYSKKLFFNAVIDIQNDFSSIDKFFLNNEAVKDIKMQASTISQNYTKSNIYKNDDYYLKTDYELFRIFYYLIRKKGTENCSRIVIRQYSDILTLSDQLKLQDRLPEKAHHGGPCLPGVQRLFINSDGFFYPCERVSETSELAQIGHIDTGFNIKKANNILNIGKVNEEACKNCWAIRFCGICISSFDTCEKEFSKKKKESCCRGIKSNVEETFKDYCFLKENGHNFTRNQEMAVFN